MSAQVCALAVVLSSGAAVAQEPPAKPPLEEAARGYYDVGVKHFNLGEYEQAIEAFREGYRISRAAGFLFNLGQAHRLKGDCAAAVRFYRTYLREDATVANREQVEATLKRIEPCPVVTTAAAAASPPTASPRYGSLVVGLAVAGAALVGTGVVFGLEAKRSADEVTGFAREMGDWTEERRRVEQRGQLFERAAIASWLLGGAALGAAAVLHLWGRPSEARTAVVPSRHGAVWVWNAAF